MADLDYLTGGGHTVCSFLISNSKLTEPEWAAVTRSWEGLSISWWQMKNRPRVFIEQTDNRRPTEKLKSAAKSNRKE